MRCCLAGYRNSANLWGLSCPHTSAFLPADILVVVPCQTQLPPPPPPPPSKLSSRMLPGYDDTNLWRSILLLILPAAWLTLRC